MTYTGYKVVRVQHGERISLTMCGHYAHVYRPGQWTEPKERFGPLCVVEHLHEAVKYAFVRWDEIWECEFEKSRLRSVWTPLYRTMMKRMPKNIVLASRVKLVKKVPRASRRKVANLTTRIHAVQLSSN